MKLRNLLTTLFLHLILLAALPLSDSWYTSFPAPLPILFWCLPPRLLSGASLSLMVICGRKNPGHLRKLSSPSDIRETSLERITQHVKSLSTSSVDIMIEHTSQMALEPKSDAKESVPEAENPYARMEVELGSDSERANRLAVIETGVVRMQHEIPATSQQPTLPIKPDQAAHSHEEESKNLSDSSVSVYLRYCPVCSVDQLLRAKHCNVCQVCVATYDHHCPWLGTCIGEKNRLSFLAFLSFQCCEVGVGLAHSLIHCGRDGFEGAGQVVLLVVLCVVALLLALLYIHHLFLIIQNLTTWEFLAKSRITYLQDWPSRWSSPFDRGVIGNFKAYCAAASVKAAFIKWQLPQLPKT